MRIESSEKEGVQVLKVGERRIVAEGAPDFRVAVLLALERDPRPLVLDLGGVEFVDSSGLGALVAILKAHPGRTLALCGLQAGVLDMFKLTRMDRVFKLYETVAEACALTAG